MLLELLVPILFWISGYSTAQDPITGPNMVSGWERGSLTVPCRYDSSWKDKKKYWCRGADWDTCEILIRTDKSNLVKKNRVSIRDNQTDFIVTVTMEDLRTSDAGIYWCGIERIGYDPKFKVNVKIDPAPTTMLTTLPITSTTTMFTESAAVNGTSISPSTSSSYSVDSSSSGVDGDGGSSSPDVDDSDDGDSGGSGLLLLSVLLPVISAVLLLLLLVASLFAWRMVKRQKKAAGPHSEQAPFPREEISYAALSLVALGQEPIYNNTGSLVTHMPSTNLEESTQYSSIKRP